MEQHTYTYRIASRRPEHSYTGGYTLTYRGNDDGLAFTLAMAQNARLTLTQPVTRDGVELSTLELFTLLRECEASQVIDAFSLAKADGPVRIL